MKGVGEVVLIALGLGALVWWNQRAKVPMSAVPLTPPLGVPSRQPTPLNGVGAAPSGMAGGSPYIDVQPFPVTVVPAVNPMAQAPAPAPSILTVNPLDPAYTNQLPGYGDTSFYAGVQNIDPFAVSPAFADELGFPTFASHDAPGIS